jgi:hypothetical protein
MGFPSEWDGETRECEPCVNYGSLCEQHFMEYEARPAQYTPQTKRLSDKEIFDIWFKNGWGSANNNELIEFVRAIEERHGI